MVSISVTFNNFLACISSLTCGVLFSWPSQSIPIMISDDYPVDITLDEASYVTVIPPIAAAISAIFYSRIMNTIGRKYSLLFICVPQLLSLILIAAANSIYIFYASRILAGIGDACAFSVLPAYVAEISTPKVRGTWGNVMVLSIYAGQLLINIVGSKFSIRHTAYIFISLPIIFAIVFAFMPESPYYQIMKGKEEDARKTLKKLLRQENVEEDLNQLVSDVNRQISEPGKFKDLFIISSNRKALLVAGFIRGAQQFGGISSFAVYTQYIFEKANIGIDPSTAAILYNLTILVTNFIFTFTLDKLGRRLAMIISCFGCTIILSMLTIYFWLATVLDLSDINWFPLFGMLLYVAFFAIGLGIVPTLILGELFSASIKGHGLCVMNVLFSIYVSSSTKLFQSLTTMYGMHVPFLLFSICLFFSTIISYYVVPETKGKTLEEIQQSLKGNETKDSKTNK